MSLIGPRPDPLDDMDIYTEHQKRKLEVKSFVWREKITVLFNSD